MRFQSNSTFSKLSPDIVADGYGPATGIGVTAVNGGITPLIPAPPAGQMTRIFSLAGAGATTVAATNLCRIQGAATGIMICGSFSQANGTTFTWSGNMAVSEAINVNNAWGVVCNSHAYYRYEPIPV